MTQRYLQPNNNNTQWFVRANTMIGNSNENITIAPDNSNNVGVVIDCSSYLQVPAGVSNERPDISNSYVGMMRYLTTDNILEYFSGQTNTWIPISLPAPTISSISPNYISFDTSGTETNSNTYTLTGGNFSNTPGGIFVEVIGNNGTGTILIPNFNSASSQTSATFTFDPSGTEQLIGISNELPFAVKLTNTNSGFSTTLNNAIIATNAGPEFLEPSLFTPFSFQTFAVQDPCANFIVGGIDLSNPPHPPLTFTFVSGTAGGFNTGGVSNISSISDFSSIVQVPTGNRLDASAGSYNFTMRVTDASNATSDANYTLTLANPTIFSIDPSFVNISDLPIDISVNGDYFIRDTNVVLHNQSTGISAEFNNISYNSTTSLTINDLSSNAGVGVYDICVNNFISPYQSFPNILTITDILDLTITQTINSGSYTDGGKTYNWYEWGPSINTTSSNTYTNAITINSISTNPEFNKIDFLIVAGGGSGGGGWQGGGGGAGGLISSVGQSGGPSTAVSPFDATGNVGSSYTVIVGGGGIPSLYNDAGSNRRSANGGNSSLFGNTSIGGGAGAGEQNLGSPGLAYGPTSGGSGGGGSHGPPAPNPGVNPGAGTPNQGNSGGAGVTNQPYVGGGGGGAGGAGIAASGSTPGNGGVGLQININGSLTYYAGGGGGTNRDSNVSNPQSTGGLGGGGNGIYTLSGTGDSGTVRTGGGGGAVGATGGGQNGQTSGTGGTGVVFIRHRIA